MIANREFRSDLYYRLNVFPIRIPPLRERREDIPLLARYFAQKFAQQMQKRIETIPTVHMKALSDWDWPGNVRELANFIERAVILTRGSSLEVPVAELRGTAPDESKRNTVWVDESKQTGAPQQWDEIVRIVQETIYALDSRKRFADEYAENRHAEIVRTLAETKGRVGGENGAAALLGLNRTTLLSRMKKLGIHPKQFC